MTATATAIRPSDATEAVLDREHLARQTMGDAELAAELLGMFENQARDILAWLARPGAEPAGAALCLHRLVGSARAVGAASVAREAERLERALTCTMPPEPWTVSGLAQAVEAACIAIRAPHSP